MQAIIIDRKKYNLRFAYFKKVERNGRAFKGDKIEFQFFAKNVGDQSSYKEVVANGTIRANNVDNTIEVVGWFPFHEDDYVMNLNTEEVFRIDRVLSKDYENQNQNNKRPIKVYTLPLSR